MRGWVVVSAALAPVALIGGWTWSAARQPPSYDPVRDTISALAAAGAADRWIMTAALATLGLCQVASAAGLLEIGPAARTLLGVGGCATIAVAALPQPNPGHLPAATISFLALALWPALAFPTLGRSAIIATGVLVALLVWLANELDSGAALGLAERVVAGSEAFGPLAIAALLRLRQRSRP